MGRTRFKIIIILLIILGAFLYRLILGSFAENRLLFDMIVYDYQAKEMIKGNLVADCCDHNMGYAAFLAPIYYFFTPDNITSLRVVQSLIDVITGLLIYIVAGNLFNKKTAAISSLIYLANPLTASYTGLKLAEIITLFMVTVVTLIISNTQFKNNLLLQLLFGVSLGLLLFIKSSLYYFVILLLFLILFLIFKTWKQKIFFLIFSLSGFLIASIYPLVSNYRWYNKVSIVPPYNVMGLGLLYLNFYNERFPELFNMGKEINPAFLKFMNEYSEATYPMVSVFKKKYEGLFLQKIRREWPLFIRNTVRNIFWMWDKNHLYYYADPFYPLDSWPIITGNIALFMFGVYGFIKYIHKVKLNISHSPMIIYTATMFLYITFVFSLVSNESRHSLPFYPLLFLWAGYGIGMINSKHEIRNTKQI